MRFRLFCLMPEPFFESRGMRLRNASVSEKGLGKFGG